MEERKIKGLFFDFDGVITLDAQGTPTIVSYLSQETGIPYGTVDRAYRRYNSDLLWGRITHRDMWGSLCEEVGRKIDRDMLERAFLNVRLDEKMVRYLREKQGEYLIGMITDNKADRIDAIIENTELKGLFDVIVISANVRCRKTEKGIFEETLRQAGLRAEECVFIDNTEENLIVPAAMGFTTIFFDDEERDYSKLVY